MVNLSYNKKQYKAKLPTKEAAAMRHTYRFETALDNLKKILQNQSNTIQLIKCGKTVCHFNPEATSGEIERFEAEFNLNLPEDYKTFLQHHNGAQLFNQVCSMGSLGEIDVGGGITIYSLDEIRSNPSRINSKQFEIASGSKIRVILDCNRYINGTQNYLLVAAENEPLCEAKKIYCNFDLWLERIILTGGEPFWEWSWYTADNY